MNEPTVCAVMLTADRPEMTRRAVECFRAQTYQNKYLVVWDSGSRAVGIEVGDDELWIRETPCGVLIGKLRNSAIRAALGNSQDAIIIHWDDDDWSHPNRIAEQVAFLQASGAEAVGYDSMLFWDSRQTVVEAGPTIQRAGYVESRGVVSSVGESWLYSGFPLGTSLCYWRNTWERVQFPDTSYGEDSEWLKRVKWQAINSRPIDDDPPMHHNEQPRMIASIHGGNTSSAYDPKQMRDNPQQWRRVPEWDGFLERTMRL